MDAVGDSLPARDVLVAPQTWSVGPFRPLLRNEGAFAYNEPRTSLGALSIIFDVEFVRNVGRNGSVARE